MIIAIDFDGTIAHTTDDLMVIGDPLPGAIEALQLLMQCHTLILWTCRGNAVLDAALGWLQQHGVVFDAINENIHPLGDGYLPRKVFAHVYIDDHAFGGFPGWDVVIEKLI